MAALQEVLEKLPSRPRPAPARGRTTRPAKAGPEIVVNDIDVTMVFTAPFAFALPKRLVDWLLQRFKTGDMQVTVSSARGKLPTAAKAAAKRTASKKTASRTARKPIRRAA